MKNITPRDYRCGFAQCPAVHEVDSDTLAIIGKKAPASVSEALSGSVGPDEHLIIIDRAMLEHVAPKE
jgi:hypothetical protein